MPYNLIYIGILIMLPSLYINSYIAMLNERKNISEQESVSYNLSKIFERRPPWTSKYAGPESNHQVRDNAQDTSSSSSLASENSEIHQVLRSKSPGGELTEHQSPSHV
ncbi:hypothetical protein BDZ97DRAFT_1879334 [Flammula alnicola]|nr:hypothetical protein BDZ97DRAFT_1879334 [Flammula alnicola]